MTRAVTLFYPELRSAGGAERLLLEELLAFRRGGWSARLATFRLEDAALFDHADLREHIDVLNKGSILSRSSALRRYLRSQGSNLVVAHGHIAAWYTMVSTLGLGIPYVAHIHGTLFWFSDDNLKYAFVNRRCFTRIRNSVLGHQEFIPERPSLTLPARLINEALALCDQIAVRHAREVIVLTEQLHWEVAELYGRSSIVARGCLDDRMLTRRDGNQARLRLKLPSGRLLFSVGRLDPRKRIDVVLKAFHMVAPSHSDTHLIVGGTGPDFERLVRIAKEMGIEDRVTFVGFVPDADLPDYFAASDVFIFPSWTSSGITTYEALAQGCRVIWTSEACEPVLGEASVVVADPTPVAFAEGIKKALEMHGRGGADVTAYSWRNYFAPVIARCDQIARSHSGKHRGFLPW